MKATFDTTNRKDLVAAIAEVTGKEKKYLGVPKCNYQVGGFIIDKNCNLTCDDKELSLLELTIERLAEDYGFHGMIEEYPENSETEEAGESLPETEGETSEGIAISMPRSMFDEVGLQNLNNLITAKQELLKRTFQKEEIRIEVDENKVTFPWFPYEMEGAQVYTTFITMLCKMATSQKRVSAKAKEITNEKYEFRCFLLRLGMIGSEYKAARKLLMKNLSGSAAFKSGAKKGGDEA